ncbi:MAG: Gfo/Idh/MocA family protein [Candidatus Hodarchaeota archaeon]
MFYNWLINLNKQKYENKSVIIIGAGSIAEAYAQALSEMKIQDVIILSRSKQKVVQLCQKYDFKPLSDGFEQHLPSLAIVDLIIIATPIKLLVPATRLAIESGQTNILVEKPVSLSIHEVLSLNEIIDNQKIGVGYNRLLYPNFQKLKEMVEEDGGITSCQYTFTEWPHLFDFSKHPAEVFRRWGIANCLHPISMAHELIGLPREISSYQFGELDWHPSGSIFVGCGITDADIPFSYHANWSSAGRWGIEVMTEKNAYRLIPLEDLYICKRGSIEWEKVPFRVAYPNTKPGIAEEIAVMLQAGNERKLDLMSLEKAISYIKLAEKIFGYDSNS